MRPGGNDELERGGGATRAADSHGAPRHRSSTLLEHSSSSILIRRASRARARVPARHAHGSNIAADKWARSVARGSRRVEAGLLALRHLLTGPRRAHPATVHRVLSRHQRPRGPAQQPDRMSRSGLFSDQAHPWHWWMAQERSAHLHQAARGRAHGRRKIMTKAACIDIPLYMIVSDTRVLYYYWYWHWYWYWCMLVLHRALHRAPR